MITNDLHAKVQDTSYGNIMVITFYTSAMFMIIVHSTILYPFLKSNI